MRIVCRQTILMKYHTLLFSKIGKDVAKFVVCCSQGLNWVAVAVNHKKETLGMRPLNI